MVTRGQLGRPGCSRLGPLGLSFFVLPDCQGMPGRLPDFCSDGRTRMREAFSSRTSEQSNLEARLSVQIESVGERSILGPSPF